ncbi:MAG: hypothetical protein GEU80_02015 [Dehalococcoidia bacterium]|nr:hypothetical protein [Dehalococcoidia bacterium]
MLAQRLLVAAAGLPLLALLLWVPERPFSLVVQVILGLAAWETVRAAAPTSDRAAAIGAGAATALYVAVVRVGDELPLWAMFAPLALVLFALLRPGDNPRGFGSTTPGWWLGAVLYTGVLGAHFVLLRNIEHGQAWLVVLLAAVFAADTGAYAVGRLLGRHAMAPMLSPKKTWEGAAGGLVLGAAVGAGAMLAFDLDPEPATLAAVAFGLPVAAMAGDLLESALKRRIRVKDMSQLLPGHGGLLDRLDSLLVAAPALYWMLQWLPM